jgi:carbohydrate-binding DOMON domain-containing protein
MEKNQIRCCYLVAVALVVLLAVGGGAGVARAQAPTATHTPIPTRTPTIVPTPTMATDETVYAFSTPVGVLEHRITDGDRMVSYVGLALILVILFLAVVVLRRWN